MAQLAFIRPLFVLGVALASAGVFAGQAQYPSGPDESLTPGELCTNGSTRRYPEQIPYCSRSVSSEEKDEIVRRYDRELGYSVERMGRQQHFKIDHFIPLCMGGANTLKNLWPQHLSISQQTDPLEQLSCDQMARGKLQQADAIRLIRTAKKDLSQVPAILRKLRAL